MDLSVYDSTGPIGRCHSSQEVKVVSVGTLCVREEMAGDLS